MTAEIADKNAGIKKDEKKWTAEQLAAMEKNCGNLLVSAGAGSGKTAVLIERIMGIITDEAQPVDVDELLVLTYTNAAAAEMRQRLTEALRQRLRQEPENEHINRQLVLVQRAKIMTLHSFCLDMLREYGYALDIDPKSRIGNEGELRILREQVLEQVFEEAYARENSETAGLKLLLRNYSRGVGDESIRELVLRLVEFARSMPDEEAWLRRLAEPYQGEPEEWLAYFGECLRTDMTEILDAASAIVRLAAKSEGLDRYLPVLEADRDNLMQAARMLWQNKKPENADEAEDMAGELADFLRRMREFGFGKLPGIRKTEEHDADAREKVQALRKQLKERLAGLINSGGSLLYGELAAENDRVRPLVEALSRLALDYHHEWQWAKKRRRLLEFDDLEHYALELLRDSDLGVAGRMQEHFFEIMVDEYQDVNEVQESILELLTNGHNRFMVGDIKQSIYRFRLAEPGLFLAKAEAYGANQGGRRVDLNRNFRSQGNILDGVNFVFGRLMCGGNMEIVYDEAAMLRCGQPDMAMLENELLIIDKSAIERNTERNSDKKSEKNAGYESTDAVESAADDFGGSETAEMETAEMENADAEKAEMEDAEKEANLIAERIKRELAAGRKPGDIVILLRAVRAWSQVMSRVLREHDIPCYAEGVEEFLRLPEVQMVRNLLAVLDNPRQDIELAAVLHSPLVGLTLAELADVRVLAKNAGNMGFAGFTGFAGQMGQAGQPFSSLYDGVKLSHDGRLVRFLLRLDGWRQKSRELGMADLLENLYNDTALPELLGGLPGGSMRRQNLRTLLGLAADYDSAGGIGIAGFLRFVEAGARDAGRSAETVGDDNVRIMSIHKSKGLEFPVVFVAGLGTKFNEEDLRKDILLHRELGLGLRRVDLEERCKYPTFGFNIITRKVRWEALAESLRILYVAMTRAKEKLYMVGTVRSEQTLAKVLAAIPDERDSDAVSAGFMEKNRNFLAWVAAALLVHRDGEKLRRMAAWQEGAVAGLPGAESKWHIEIVNELTQIIGVDGDTAFDVAAWLAAEMEADDKSGKSGESGKSGISAEKISEALRRYYPGGELAGLPVKWSVTALQRLGMAADVVDDAAENTDISDIEAGAAEIKALDEAAEICAAENSAVESGAADNVPEHDIEWYAAYGTLVHKLLERADLVRLAAAADNADTAEISAAAATHLTKVFAGVRKNYPADVADSVRPKRIARFFASELGRRLLGTVRAAVVVDAVGAVDTIDTVVLREQRFVAGMRLADLERLDAEVAGRLAAVSGVDIAESGEEQLFMQGVIDLAFREADGWVLVDYKSGGNRNRSDEDVRQQYGLQLKIYADVLQRATGQPVSESYIYFTANDRSVRIF